MSRQASDVRTQSRRSATARLRYEAGLTQEELASELCVSLRTIQRIEGGSYVPRPGLAGKLAARLGVAIRDLDLAEAA